MVSSNGLSVCVPTHAGRGSLVVDLLDTVVDASARLTEPVEILVVDDSNGAESTAVARKCDETGALYLRGPRSAGVKRNVAASHARYDLLFFVDSDCLLARETLETHVRELRAAPSDIAGIAGRTEMVGDMTRVWQALDRSRVYNTGFDFTDAFEEVAWSATCNLSVRRDVFEKVGGFAEDSFTPVGGEDVDLGIRVVDDGFRWLTSPTAIVYHRRDPSVRFHHALRKLFTFGRADVFLTQRHTRRRQAQGEPVLRPHRGGATMASIGGALLDAAFHAGVAWEAARRVRPGLALRRFPYTDARGFVPRRGTVA